MIWPFIKKFANALFISREVEAIEFNEGKKLPAINLTYSLLLLIINMLFYFIVNYYLY